jgi:hypothetical protein
MSSNERKLDHARTGALRGQRGITLVESVISVALATMIMGSLVAVQRIAGKGFSGTVGEVRLTYSMREGIGSMKEELRSVLSTSIVINPLVDAVNHSESTPTQSGYRMPQFGAISDGLTDGVTLFSFQEAVNFDSSTGQTSWGGGNVIDGTVEYYVLGHELRRRVRQLDGSLVPAEDRGLVQNLDRTGHSGMPIEFEWTATTGYLGMFARTEVRVQDKPVRREVKTVVHLESVFKY